MTKKQHFAYTIPTFADEITRSKLITFEALATTKDIAPQFLDRK